MTSFARLASLAILFGLPVSAFAMATFEEYGRWPESWPSELGELRARSYTYDLASGTREHVYSIPFRSVEEFRRIWPVLRGLATPGAPITLKPLGTAGGKLDEWDFTGPMVQIFGPTESITGTMPWRDSEGRVVTQERVDLAIRKGAGELLTEEELAVLDADTISDGELLTTDAELMSDLEARGATLRSYAPWPDYLYDENGALPEYVTREEVDGKLRWKASDSFEAARGFRYRARVEIVLYVDGDVIDPAALQLPPTLVLVDER